MGIYIHKKNYMLTRVGADGRGHWAVAGHIGVGRADWDVLDLGEVSGEG